MNKPLYQLSAEYQRVLDKIENTDEITPELMDELNAIHESTENKILSKTSIVKSLEAEAEAIEKAIQEMCQRGDSLIKKAKIIREEIKREMELCHLEKAKNPYHEVRILLNNPKVDDIDENLLPSTYIKEKIFRLVDRMNILRDLKAGKEIPGARLVRETRLQIR